MFLKDKNRVLGTNVYEPQFGIFAWFALNLYFCYLILTILFQNVSILRSSCLCCRKQRDPPTVVHASIHESVGAVDLGPCTAVPTIMDNTPGFPDLDSSLSPPSKRSNMANGGMFARVCCMFCPVQSRCFIALWPVFWIRIYWSRIRF